MELNYDWKSFQTLFPLRKKSVIIPEVGGPIYVVTDKRVIVSALSAGQDLSDWVGATYDELMAEFPHREVMAFDREKIDKTLGAAVNQTHFYDQIQYIRTEGQLQTILPNKNSRSCEPYLPKHFLLNVIQSWWRKVLPSSYGIYIRVEGTQESSLLMIVQRERLSSFHVPDLSSMMAEKRKSPPDIVKFLSERHLVPVQGLFLTAQEWTEWSAEANPWPQIASTLKENRTKLVPMRWGVALLIGMKGFLHF